MEDKKTTVAENAVAKTETAASETHNLVEQAVTRGVEAFIDAHLRNSEFSRDTPAWNHFQAGLPVLIGSILAELEV